MESGKSEKPARRWVYGRFTLLTVILMAAAYYALGFLSDTEQDPVTPAVAPALQTRPLLEGTQGQARWEEVYCAVARYDADPGLALENAVLYDGEAQYILPRKQFEEITAQYPPDAVPEHYMLSEDAPNGLILVGGGPS